MRFVVVANPKARRFRDDPDAIQALYRITSGRGLLLTPASPDELVRELITIRAERPEFVAVAGGDGTVSRFTTALLATWDHDDLPPVGLLHGGTMNTISTSMGNRGEAASQLEALVRGDGVKRTRRWPLRIGHDRYGYLFGVGIVPRYIEAYDAGPNPGPGQAARTLFAKVLAAFQGDDESRAFFEKVRLDITVDGQLLPLKSWLIVALGAVDDLGLRYRPFPGLLDTPAAMGLYASASTPARFALDLPWFRFARPVAHSLAFQQLASEVTFTGPRPIQYNLDGDLETVGTTLRVRVGPPITFLLPPGARPPRNDLGP